MMPNLSKRPSKAAEAQTWYLLVVTQQRTIPADNKTEIDCTLIRMPEDSDQTRVKAMQPS
jgi:hypothetical protein